MLGAADKNLPRAGDAGGLGQWLGGLVKGTGRNNNEQTEQRRRDCKRRLAAAVAQKQSAESRQNVEELLEELVAIGGTPGGLESQDLSGRWVLAWSSQTADAWPFALPSEVLGGDCFQDIDKAPGAGIGRVCNIVDWPALGMTLRGGAALETVNATRSIIRIDSFTLEIGPLSLPLLSLTNSSGFEITANDAPKVPPRNQGAGLTRNARLARAHSRVPARAGSVGEPAGVGEAQGREPADRGGHGDAGAQQARGLPGYALH